MAAASDPPSVGRSSEHHLRRFRQAERAGDAAGAAEAWSDVVVQEHDRLRGFVRVQARRMRLSHAEREDAESLALAKFFAEMRTSLDGESMGELVGALRTCAWFACQDVQREAARSSERRASLEVAGEDGEVRLHPGVARRSAAAHRDEQADAEEADAEDRERACVAWALGALLPERREVYERTAAGETAADIAQALGISIENVYQRRSRAIKDLRRLKEQWDG